MISDLSWLEWVFGVIVILAIMSSVHDRRRERIRIRALDFAVNQRWMGDRNETIVARAAVFERYILNGEPKPKKPTRPPRPTDTVDSIQGP